MQHISRILFSALLKRFLFSSLFVLCTTSVSSFANEDPLSLRTPLGEKTSLDNYVGENNGNKWLLVMIWSTDCSVCFKEMPRIADFHQRHRAIDASVLGIALDGYERRDAVARFAANNGLDFPNLIAEMPAFALRYEFEVGENLLGTPHQLTCCLIPLEN